MAADPPNLRYVSAPPAGHGGYPVTDAALEALSAAEERHFWHATRNELIAERLARLGVVAPQRILELGCGGGCVSAHLARAGYSVTGVDGNLARLRVAARRAPDASFVAHDLSRGLPDGLGGPFDAAGLFDVIEHLDDPVGALEGAVTAVRTGGIVAGTVPAEMALWSAVDEAAGHRTRYDPASLAAVVGRVRGANVIEVVPFNRSIYPLVWLQRRVARRDPATVAVDYIRVPAPLVNRALSALLRLERRGRLPGVTACAGTSLWFALRRC